MGMFKRQIYFLVMVFIFFFGVTAYSEAIEKNEIFGDWKCLVETDEAEEFVFFLYFTEPNGVTFVADWNEGEIASTYTGHFTMEGDGLLKLDMTEADSSDTLTGIFSFDITSDTLVLIKQSGDSLSYLFEIWEPMEFTPIFDVNS